MRRFSFIPFVWVIWLFQLKSASLLSPPWISLFALSDTVKARGHSVRQTLLQRFVFLMSYECWAPRQMRWFLRWGDEAERFSLPPPPVRLLSRLLAALMVFCLEISSVKRVWPLCWSWAGECCGGWCLLSHWTRNRLRVLEQYNPKESWTDVSKV